jgi:hypothetical protein
VRQRRTVQAEERDTGFEPATFSLGRAPEATQSEALRGVASDGTSRDDPSDSRGFAEPHGESSRIVTETRVECTDAPATSDEALRLAIKLAVDAGEYERAAALLEVAKGTRKPGTVTPLDAVRGRRE